MPNARHTAWGGGGQDGSAAEVPVPDAILKPASPVTNDVLAWNGSAWTNVDDLTIDNLTVTGTGDILIGSTRQPKITRLDIDDGPPGSPVDGDIWIAEDVNAENSGVAWQFIYNADSSSTHKWEFVGGPWLMALVNTEESTSSATAADLATVGPQLAAPRAGEYQVRHGFDSYKSASLPGVCFGEIDLNGVDQGVTTRVLAPHETASATGSCERLAPLITVATAGHIIKLQYAVTGGGSGFFNNRRLAIQPIRVS